MKKFSLSFVLSLFILVSCKETPPVVPVENLEGNYSNITINLNNVWFELKVEWSSQVPYGGPSTSGKGTTESIRNMSWDYNVNSSDTISTTSNSINSYYRYVNFNPRSSSSIERKCQFAFDLSKGLITTCKASISSFNSGSTSPGGSSSSGSNLKTIEMKNLPFQKSGDTLITVSISGKSLKDYILSCSSSNSYSSSTGIAGGSGAGSSSEDSKSIYLIPDSASVNIMIRR